MAKYRSKYLQCLAPTRCCGTSGYQYCATYGKRTCVDQIDVFARQHVLEILHRRDCSDLVDTSADDTLQ
jgi:hypothetical protein